MTINPNMPEGESNLSYHATTADSQVSTSSMPEPLSRATLASPTEAEYLPFVLLRLLFGQPSTKLTLEST